MGNQQLPHDVGNYTIGKGILSIGEWSHDIAPASYDDIGNCSNVELELVVERRPRFSPETDFMMKEDNPVVRVEYAVNFDCDEMAAVNLNRYLMGSLSGNVISSFENLDKKHALKFISDNPVDLTPSLTETTIFKNTFSDLYL